jgi:hypothetical protein
MLPAKKVTVPPGIPIALETIAVSVIIAPSTGVVVDAVSAVVVGIAVLVIMTDAGDEPPTTANDAG